MTSMFKQEWEAPPEKDHKGLGATHQVEGQV